MKKLSTILLGAAAVLFLAGCVGAVAKKTPDVQPLPPGGPIGATDGMGFPFYPNR